MLWWVVADKEHTLRSSNPLAVHGPNVSRLSLDLPRGKRGNGTNVLEIKVDVSWTRVFARCMYSLPRSTRARWSLLRPRINADGTVPLSIMHNGDVILNGGPCIRIYREATGGRVLLIVRHQVHQLSAKVLACKCR